MGDSKSIFPRNYTQESELGLVTRVGPAAGSEQ